MRNIRNPYSGVSLSGPGIVLIAALGMALPPDALAEGKPGDKTVGPGRTGDDRAARAEPQRHITRPHREGQGGETSARHHRNHEVLTVMGARGGYAAAESAMGDKRATPFLQQTQTTNVVTHQTLADFSPQTMEDMAKYVPGMAIGNNFGGTQDALIKRGFGAIDDGSILRDGVRMPIGRNYQGDTAERVEILKGPASLFYGMQEPGGVINVITKAPDFRRWGAALGTQWSSLGGGNGHVDVTGPLGKTLAFRLIGSYRNENYWRNFGANKQILVAPTLNWHRERWDGALSYEYVDYDNVLDRGAVFVGNNPVSGPQKRLDEPWTASFGARHLIASHLGYRIGMHDRLRLSGGYNRDDYHDRQADPSSYSARTGILLRRYRANGGTIRANGSVALDYLGDHDLWGMRHEITAGIDYENRNQDQGVFYQSANQGGFTPANPVYGGAGTRRAPQSGEQQSAAEHQFGIWLFQGQYPPDKQPDCKRRRALSVVWFALWQWNSLHPDDRRVLHEAVAICCARLAAIQERFVLWRLFAILRRKSALRRQRAAGRLQAHDGSGI